MNLNYEWSDVVNIETLYPKLTWFYAVLVGIQQDGTMSLLESRKRDGCAWRRTALFGEP